MFTTFLLGTLLASVLVLVVLLLLPRRRAAGDDRFPYEGMTIALLMAAVAFLGGLAVLA